MTSLFDYMKQCQRFIHDSKQEMVDPEDLIAYINRARREVALRTKCLRILPPIAGSIVTANVTSPGSGYTNPTASITAPDFPSGLAPFPLGNQATAIATQIGGALAGVNIDYGGDGYFQPIITINDPTGSGAVVVPQLSWINALNEGQEVYNFSDINLSMFPGVRSVFAVHSVSIIYANYRYSLPQYSFTTYQAYVRQYPFQYSYVPTICCQRGQGTAGSMYFYPYPSQTYQMDWDCYCLPSDLLTDQDYEALPEPWTEGVPFMAAYFAYHEMQNFNYALGYQKQFDDWMSRYSGYARSGRATNPYGRF